MFNSATDARNRDLDNPPELNLAPNMNVRDNIFIGREIMTSSGVDFAEETRVTRHLMKSLEEDIDPLTPVENLRLAAADRRDRPCAVGEFADPDHG